MWTILLNYKPEEKKATYKNRYGQPSKPRALRKNGITDSRMNGNNKNSYNDHNSFLQQRKSTKQCPQLHFTTDNSIKTCGLKI